MQVLKPKVQPEWESRDALPLAFAAVLLTRKATPRATKRCRKRVSRAVRSLEAGDTTGSPEAALAAAGALRVGCRLCGKCPGLTITRPLPVDFG